ncbi:MAG: tyrosine-type recombinase/integrase [Bdellovibrionales bacterium]
MVQLVMGQNVLTEAKFLNDEELKTLFVLLERHKTNPKTDTEYRDSLLLRLALRLSGRSCEILKLRPKDLGKDTVTLWGAKGSNSRTLPLPIDLVRELKEYCKDLTTEARIFPISTRHFRRIWDQYRPNASKGAHSMRHTGALKLYSNCRDLKAVQYMLGQKEIKNTMVYLDFVEGAQKLRSQMKGMWNKKAI